MDLRQRVENYYQDYPEMPYISPDRDLQAFIQEVELSKSALVARSYLQRTSEGYLPGEIVLLWRVALGTFTNQSMIPKYFEYRYGINWEEALNTLLDDGLIRQLSARESLPLLSIPKIRHLLKELQLQAPSQLKKADLVAWAQEYSQEEDLAPLMSLRAYEITDAGQTLLDQHPDIIQRHGPKG